MRQKEKHGRSLVLAASMHFLLCVNSKMLNQREKHVKRKKVRKAARKKERKEGRKKERKKEMKEERKKERKK